MFMPEQEPLSRWIRFKHWVRWKLGWRYIGCVGLWSFFTFGKRNGFELITALMPDICFSEIVSVQPMTRKHKGIFHLVYIYPPFKRTWSWFSGLKLEVAK